MSSVATVLRSGVSWRDHERAAGWLAARRWPVPVAWLRRLGAARVLLLAFTIAHGATFSRLVLQRHRRFGTFDYDLGIFDQNVWLLAEGESFMTVRGLDVFGHHVSVAHYLFVPFYRLGAGPDFLDLAMIAAVCASALPLWRIGMRHLDNEWHTLVLVVAFLVHPSVTWLMWETYHPEVMAIPFFLAAYDAAQRQRWAAYAIWLVLAVAWKEDVALAAMMLGFLLVWRRRSLAGSVTIAASAGWFVLATMVIIPAFTPEGTFFSTFYSHLGGSPGGIASTAVTDPTAIYRQLHDANAVGYVRDLSAPFAFTWLLAPGVALMALPQLAANLLSQNAFTWNSQAHYVAVVLTSMVLGSIEGIGKVGHPGFRRFLIGSIAALTLYTTMAWGIGPGADRYGDGYWYPFENPKQEVMDRVVALPEPDDSVAATYNLVPHLSQRRAIYSFPNPWRTWNWGVDGEDPHDPATVDWLIVDTPLLGDLDALVDGILATGEWETVVDEDGILAARRTR